MAYDEHCFPLPTQVQNSVCLIIMGFISDLTLGWSWSKVLVFFSFISDKDVSLN
jgi:hypothetical protein